MHPEKLIGLKEGQLAAECKFLTRLTIQVGFIFVLLTSCVFFCFVFHRHLWRYGTCTAHFTAHRIKTLTHSHSLQTQDSVFIKFNCCNNDEEGIRESIGFAQELDAVINNTGPTSLANGDVVRGLFDLPMFLE